MFDRAFTRRTVSRDLVLWLTITISLIVGLLALSYYFYSTARLQQQLETEAEELTTEIADVLLPPLHNLNFETVNHIAKVYQRNPYITGLRIQTDYGKVIFDTLPPGKDNHFSKNRTLYINKVEQGVLMLHFTDSPLKDQQKDILITTILITLLILGVMVLGTRLFMRRYLQHPLERLADGIKLIARGEYDNPLPPVAQEDLSAIIREVNSMAAQISSQNRQLAASEKKYRSIFDNSLEGIFQSTPQGRFLTVNPAMAKILGYDSVDELLAEDFDIAKIYANPDERQQLINLLERQPSVLGFEIQGVCKDGSSIIASLSIHMVRDHDGKILHMEGMLEDITKRKQAEDELRQVQNYLKNIIDSMPSVLVGVDSEGRITQWNKEAAEQTGISPEEARSCLLSDVLPQLAGEMERVKEAIAKRQVEKDARVASHEQGGTKYTDITIYPLIANGVEGAVIRMDDITDRVRIEEMMIQTEKMMSVGGLAAGMAHEINNPLAGIMQNLQVLQLYLTEDTPKNRRIAEECDLSFERLQDFFAKREVPAIIESVLDSGKRAAKIVDNMLSFSRKSDKGFTANDLADLLDKTVELAANDYDLKKKYDFRRIEIVREYEDDAPEVYCEASQVQQVFLNILKNGAQAMAESRSREKAKFVLKIITDGDLARIEIEDNGSGMDEATRKRVFEPFFTTKDVGVGTGLGMSVSYFIIAENHGGSMEVESTPGNGARFIIKLPLTRSE